MDASLHKSAFHRISSTPPDLIVHDDLSDEDSSCWSSSPPPLPPTPSPACADCGSSTCFGTACKAGVLASIRKHVALARQGRLSRPRLYRPQKRRVTQITVPPRSSTTHQQQPKQQQHVAKQQLLPPLLSSSPPATAPITQQGRPCRAKAPCQACREPADSCMRKAYNWPFPTSDLHFDKGRPYVYLCNKCGLRYNKSGGCVCRHCRWVLCKEEKRKAVQHIAYMRRTRGHVEPEDPIIDFVCSPKYWVCGHPWKVGWISEKDDDDNTTAMDDTTSPPHSSATTTQQ
ncbi:hypothetical protein O0I10_001113 [Lichtheimia ornata]|uniref:Uncharacterized protein n=1 Tax=Lichtheimia ornata TaxID=688661 RepID=A0AAD7Y376_9FUNG|nr:uncharacterized protein O0I10_001113 [Lichtheimia ornata]KAJ8662937.1 hypothetical protein O0I10_001113 [Lichtheimia ornata]